METKIKTDQVNDLDLLDRKRFAKEVSDNILQHFETSDESLVIGIHGPWGSGKSTLLHFIKENIKLSSLYINGKKPAQKTWWHYLNKSDPSPPEKKLFLMEFNPWIFSGKEELHWNFLNEFAHTIQSKKHLTRATRNKFIKGLKMVAELSGREEIGKSIGEFAKVSIEQLKAEISAVLKQENIWMVIVIDDVDRLTPAEILEIFQLVKLNANFSHTLFILSFDKNVVGQSIENQFKLDGDKYLEKIIQVDYSMPSILQEEIESMYFKRLQNLLDEFSITFEVGTLNSPWLIEGLNHYFKNIRDLNRYFNSVRFRLPAIHAEVDIHDFLILEAIRLFDFPSYEIIWDNYKEAKQFGGESYFANNLMEIEQNSIKLYRYLFEQKSNPKEKAYRVYDVEFFDRYFSLTISKKDMREQELKDFIAHPTTRKNLLNTIITNGKIDFLLRRLTTNTDPYKSIAVSEIISVLISVWDDHRDAFTEHWRTLWNTVKTILLASRDPQEGIRLLLNELHMSSSSFSPGRFVFTWVVLRHNEPHTDLEVNKDLEPFDEFLKSKRESLIKNFQWMLDNYQSHFLYHGTFNVLYQRIFFFSFAIYQPEKYLAAITQLIKDESRIFKILDLLVFRDSTSREPFGIDERYLEILLPGDLKAEFVKQLEAINPKALSKADANTLQKYLVYSKEKKDPFKGRRNP